MKFGKEGIALLRHFEGHSLVPYLDPVGIPTIGVGHTAGVTMDMLPITEEQEEEFLLEDVADAEASVRRLVTVPLTQNQYDSLVCFVFNLGAGKFYTSTLRRLLNEGKYAQAAAEFPRWNKAGGRVLPGLVRRREAERRLFEKPDSDSDTLHPAVIA